MELLRSLPYSSMAGALEYQSELRPNKCAILYPDSTKDWKEYTSLTYYQYNNVVNHLSDKLREYIPYSSSNESLTCGILSVGGIEYLLCQYALLKLGNVIMFPISARNSSLAIEHLLRETKTTFLITKTEYLSMIETIKEQKEFQSLKVFNLDTDQLNVQEYLKKKDLPYLSRLNSIQTNISKSDEELNKVVMILHSTGSTAHPKAIRLTNRYFLISYFLYLSINKHFWEENDVILSWGALFHLLAFNGTVRSILTGCTYAIPLCSTFPPKPDELLNNIQVPNGITVLITVPSLLETLIHQLLDQKNEQIGLKPLQKLKFVMYGGAGCPDNLCKTLVDNGVVLLSVYGATETGVILVNNYNPYEKRWKFMEIADVRRPYLRLEQAPNSTNPNEKVLIHLSNDPFLAENVCHGDENIYTVGDILLEDPPNSGRYFVIGRQDDTLVHLNGEKTNPIIMEHSIRRSPYIKEVAIVGHNQFCTGALIQLNIDPSTLNKEIEEQIWNVIEQVNKEVPSHSRLLRSLIRILEKDQILPVTDKGNLSRQKVNQLYSKIIEQIYSDFSNEQNLEKNRKKENSFWNKETIGKYLEEKFQSIVNLEDMKQLKDSSRSIFDLGFNSLEVLELRNFICEDICQIPKNFLYEYSRFNQICDQLFQYVHSNQIPFEENLDPFHYQLTEDIIDKYIHFIENTPIQSFNQRKSNQFERVFLLTGANGSLGTFLIRDLLQKPRTDLKRLFCLLRGTNPKERLFQAFEQRQLSTSILTEAIKEQRLILFESSMNLTDEYFGLKKENYQILKEELTDIIHSAWKMNFNQTIQDFEYDSILGAYHLLKLASFNPIQFHFISSISSAGSGLFPIIEEKPLPRNLPIALPQGYGQSKYATEHISWAATQFWNVPVNIYRVGQISGDTLNGIWNTNEMAPMIIYAGAGQLKQIPNIGNDINWIPVDICSQSIVSLALNSSFDYQISVDQRVYHILNPHSISYEEYIQILKEAGLHFDIVQPKEFLQTILKSKDLNNPLIKLIPFLEQIFEKKDSRKSPKYQTIKTEQKCQILKDCPQIDSNLIQLYFNYWNKSKLIDH